MHPGVADAAERDEVCQGVVCRVQVDVMDVEVFGSAADGALLPVAFQDRGPHRLPPPESVLLPRPDGDPELLAEDRTVLADGERALVAEPEEAVPVRVAVAERRQRAVKRIKAELQVGGHVR